MADQRRRKTQSERKIVIIGGGVAGLTAAHELKERGFTVVIYEREDFCGGKARSFPVPASAKPAIRGLPAEHGFRFFPGFYRHLPRTMSRIPYGRGRYVNHNLVEVARGVFARQDRPFFNFPTESPPTARDWLRTMRRLLDNPSLGLGPGEAGFAALRLFNAMTMCNERRQAELDYITWWDYLRADDMSDAYRRVAASGLTQNFVAMKAKISSTKSVINILARLINDLMTPGSTMDRVLNGPTSEVWIEPWVHYLASDSGGPPVVFHNGAEFRVESLMFDRRDSSIMGVELASGQKEADPQALYIAAVPVEAMRAILTKTPEMLEHSPSLKLLDDLKVNWMSGLVYYIARNDVPMTRGHIAYLDSNWALTSISQNQFWTRKVEDYGNPDVKGVLSVIISDWFTPGNHSGKSACASDSPEEAAAEALAEIQGHLIASGVRLADADIVGSWLDPAIIYNKSLLGLMSVREFAERKRKLELSPAARRASKKMKGRNARDEEPLFINTVGSWVNRPTERTGIRNLFLASDYVKTNTDLATMEGANEAARRAVNAVLETTRSKQKRCEIFQFAEPAVLAPFRAIDQYLFERRIPHPSFFVEPFLDFGAIFSFPARGWSSLRRTQRSGRKSRHPSPDR